MCLKSVILILLTALRDVFPLRRIIGSNVVACCLRLDNRTLCYSVQLSFYCLPYSSYSNIVYYSCPEVNCVTRMNLHDIRL